MGGLICNVAVVAPLLATVVETVITNGFNTPVDKRLCGLIANTPPKVTTSPTRKVSLVPLATPHCAVEIELPVWPAVDTQPCVDECTPVARVGTFWSM